MRETDNSVKMLKVNDDIGVSQASFRRCVRVYASQKNQNKMVPSKSFALDFVPCQKDKMKQELFLILLQ